MAGWLHGVFVGDWLFVFPLCGFSLSLFLTTRDGITVPSPYNMQAYKFATFNVACMHTCTTPTAAAYTVRCQV